MNTFFILLSPQQYAVQQKDSKNANRKKSINYDVYCTIESIVSWTLHIDILIELYSVELIWPKSSEECFPILKQRLYSYHISPMKWCRYINHNSNNNNIIIIGKENPINTSTHPSQNPSFLVQGSCFACTRITIVIMCATVQQPGHENCMKIGKEHPSNLANCFAITNNNS